MSLSHLSVEDIAILCFSKFKCLPKTGKPNDKEWTVLAGIVQHNSLTDTTEVISLGCGTKCIGKSRLCSKGLILNDSHAEVLARRALIRYFYYHLKKALINESETTSSIFQWVTEDNKFRLKKGLSFHFFSTQTPCGDACIIASDDEAEEPHGKRPKLENSIAECLQEELYTGAKLLGPEQGDLMQQVIGAVRTKPGRGERTLSMSCSDKLAKWNVMGIQGALLAILLQEPIYLKSLNFCGSNNLNSLQRAIWKRFENKNCESTKYKLHVPKIQVCVTSNFEYAQDATKQPSPNGLAWCNLPDALRPYEISVNGKRQGVTRKKLNSSSSSLSISRYKLFKEFVDVIKMKPEILPNIREIENKSYLDVKMLATEYIKAWYKVKEEYFLQWSSKPQEFLMFSLAEENCKKESNGISI